MIEFKEFDETLDRGTGPDLTPLIDMVFLLLIFFLLTTFFTRPSIPVSLPESETAVLNEQPEITITIKKDGDLLLNGEQVAEDGLLRSLNSLYEFHKSKEVIIQADREVSFGRVISIMDIAKTGGAEHLSFLVEYKR
jgi:biopolymer transport protein ExbD